jgi:Ser-tRNA(Ala) deacylase AlaX
MPDRKRFYDDPALDRLTTSVVETGTFDGRPWVRLEETLFYPEGGGQPSDRGAIGEATVLDVVARGDEVLHMLDRNLAVGPVAIRLDAARRFDHCQQHTAQHLLTAVLLERHGWPTTSFHLGAEYTAIEVKGPVPSREALRRFEREVNAHLREDRKVEARWVPPEDLPALGVRSRGLPEGHRGPVRLVAIEGLDLNTCGGTHVARLGEIQAIEIVDAEAARGGARIRFLAGERVFADLHQRRDVEEALKARIGTAPQEFAAVLDGWDAERKRLERRVRSLEAEIAESVAGALASAPERVLCAIRPGAAPEALRALAIALGARRPEAVAVLVGDTGEPSGACFLVQAGPAGPDDVAALGGRVRDLLGSKGGGKGKTFQGKGGALPSLDDLERAARGGA